MIENFLNTVWQHYSHNKRDMPWRNIVDLSDKDRGYRVFVSEVMLQQTQVSRVIDKYTIWMEKWPTIDSFVTAPLAEVVIQWSGLGYNRRAKYLFESLHIIHSKYNGIIPTDSNILESLPGIGPNTAAAILVYTYNKPIPFIETNIRTVYIHSFFATNKEKVSDKEIMTLVTKTIDTDNPREWFYALMDYGTYLKKHHGNQLQKAHAHKKQSTFNGSKRQVRGKVVKLLTEVHFITAAELKKEIDDDRLDEVIKSLLTEGLIIRLNNTTYTLPNR